MNIISFKNILDALRDVVEQQLGTFPNHSEIKTFGWGDLSDINTINIEGILMYVVPLSKEFVTENYSKYKFDIYFLDVVNSEIDNRLDILENTQAVATDILKKLGSNHFKKHYNFNLKSNSDLNVVLFDFEQNCLGWTISTYSDVYEGSECKINMT